MVQFAEKFKKVTCVSIFAFFVMPAAVRAMQGRGAAASSTSGDASSPLRTSMQVRRAITQVAEALDSFFAPTMDEVINSASTSGIVLGEDKERWGFVAEAALWLTLDSLLAGSEGEDSERFCEMRVAVGERRDFYFGNEEHALRLNDDEQQLAREVGRALQDRFTAVLERASRGTSEEARQAVFARGDRGIDLSADEEALLARRGPLGGERAFPVRAGVQQRRNIPLVAALACFFLLKFSLKKAFPLAIENADAMSRLDPACDLPVGSWLWHGFTPLRERVWRELREFWEVYWEYVINAG